MLTFKSFSSSSYPYAYRNVLLIQERKNVCEKMGSNNKQHKTCYDSYLRLIVDDRHLHTGMLLFRIHQEISPPGGASY